MLRKQSSLLLLLLTLSITSIKCDVSNEAELDDFLTSMNFELAAIYNQQADFAWLKDAYYSEEDAEEESPEEKALAKELIKLKKFIHDETHKLDPNTITDEKLREQLKHLPQLDYEALDEKDMKELEDTTTNMSLTYRSVPLCSYKDQMICNLTLIPDVQNIIFYSNDTKEIEYYWNEWSTKSGTKSKDDFARFVKLYRKVAKMNGYEKPSDYWFRKFGDSAEIIKILNKIMSQLKPLFEHFHGRVRDLLRDKYGSDTIQYNWPYPLHLSEKYIGAAFRNEEHDGIVLPYRESEMPNITDALLKQGFLPRSFFELAESFYQSIGLKGLDNDFWDKNVLPKSDPSETYLYCTNKPYNYYSTDLLRMTHCPNVDFLRYMNMFESVAALHFHQESKIQPALFQMEPFPEFLDSLGKIFSLSATTPSYLEKVGILPNNSFNSMQRLNRLYFLGFQEIFVLPVLYVLDKYRFDVLNVDLKAWDNCAYWDLNEKYIGAIPPIKRSNRDFDIPSKLLVAVDEIYSGTILGTVMKYQVYKYLCEKTGQYVKGNVDFPLDYCDLSGHPEIGENISKAMALGSSKPWPEILAALTDGQKELSLDGFLEYFEALFEWLKDDKLLNKYEIGWKDSKQCEK